MDDGTACAVVEVCHAGKLRCVPFYLVVICTESKRQILMFCFAFCFILSLIHISLKG